jgi:hypothetical protein
MTPHQVRDQLLVDGFNAELDDSAPEITFIRKVGRGIDGFPFDILFHHASPHDGNLDKIEGLSFSLPVALDDTPNSVRLNEANSQYRFLKGYEEQGYVWVEMDTMIPDLILSKEKFQKLFTTWTAQFPLFVKDAI